MPLPQFKAAPRFSPLVRLAALLATATLAPAATFAAPNCRAMTFDVTGVAAEPAQIHAQVCASASAAPSAPVQLLLHGGSYDHRYWDVPLDPDRYSYVTAATEQGYITVNVDRLGYGDSTRPDGATLTFEAGAAAMSQVIDQIQSGALGEPPRHIVLNGHSMGGIVAEIIAGTRSDIAALIVSGLANTPEGDDDAEDDETGPGGPGEGGPPTGAVPFIDAAEDPRFAAAPWAQGYMTTAPGARMHIFHAPDTYAPDVAELEHEMRDTIAGAELRSVMSGGTERPVFAGPKVYFLGQYDVIACEGRPCDQRFPEPGAHQIIAAAGHSINLSLAAPEFYQQTFDWLAGQGLAP